MKQVIEAGECAVSDLSLRGVLMAGKDKFGCRIELIQKTAGYEPAGAAMRYTNEGFGVIGYAKNGTTYGQWYKTLMEAEKGFCARNVVQS